VLPRAETLGSRAPTDYGDLQVAIVRPSFPTAAFGVPTCPVDPNPPFSFHLRLSVFECKGFTTLNHTPDERALW
jgi:hypothetical protein